MIYSIFFSWQSEKREASDFIRNALKEIVPQLEDELSVTIRLTEADTDNRGSYNINSAVENALHDADIVIADLTPTSTGSDGRHNPNTNAIFEYAMAWEHKGNDNVIATACLDGVQVSKLPFDFNHNALVGFSMSDFEGCKKSLKSALEKILRTRLKPVLYDATTVFFTQRIASAFPGVRGLKVYEDQSEIRKRLDRFFAHPIVFGEAIDRDGDKEPLWWFRGGSSNAITSYDVSSGNTYLIGWKELKIKRLAVYSDHARYYSQYLYIEAEPLEPVIDKDYYSKEKIADLLKDSDYVDEEYAVVKEGKIPTLISRQCYDDGYAEIHGEIIRIPETTQIRCRFLTPFNFIVTAKFSSYNRPEFDQTSREYFNGLLKGTKTLEEFHDYLMKFPKPSWR